MPSDFGGALPILTKHDPCVILRQCQMNIAQSKNLTGCHNSKRNAKAVQLPNCKCKKASGLSSAFGNFGGILLSEGDLGPGDRNNKEAAAFNSSLMSSLVARRSSD